MFSRLFGDKKKGNATQNLPVPQGANWSFLGADMHSHLIPGIDDGAKTVEDSVKLVRAMKDMGFRTLITTPHTMIDYYPNTTETIQKGLKVLQDALEENNIDISIRAASEYYIDEYFLKLLESEPLLTIRDKEVLVEFSMMYEPPTLAEVIFRMLANGYRPIIAHPERYLFFHKDMSRYRELKDRGCLLQLNILSISGYYGKNIKMIADQLLAQGLYDYCGSDMHHEKHAAVLKTMVSTKDYHTFATYPFLNSKLCF